MIQLWHCALCGRLSEVLDRPLVYLVWCGQCRSQGRLVAMVEVGTTPEPLADPELEAWQHGTRYLGAPAVG